MTAGCVFFGLAVCGSIALVYWAIDCYNEACRDAEDLVAYTSDECAAYVAAALAEDSDNVR